MGEKTKQHLKDNLKLKELAMSNRALILTSVLLATTLAACGSGSKGPADTLLEMHSKMCETMSYQPLLDYTAPQSQALVGTVVSMMADPKKGPELKKELADKCKDKMTVVSENIDGDTASVTLSGDKKPTEMIKIDGKWKMVVNKK